MQNLFKNNINWDEPIDVFSANEWLKWKNNLMTLN